MNELLTEYINLYGNVIRSKDFMITADQPCHPREGIPHFMKGFYKIVLLNSFTSSLMFFIVCQCEKQH
jgi:hypothetical protein